MDNLSRITIQTIAFLVIVGTLSACGIVKDVKASRNRDRMGSLRIGMNQQEVTGLMGKPWKSEAFLKSGEVYNVLYYVTQRIPDGATTDEEMTPVVFRDGSLVGWGRRFFSDLRVEVKHVDDE